MQTLADVDCAFQTLILQEEETDLVAWQKFWVDRCLPLVDKLLLATADGITDDDAWEYGAQLIASVDWAVIKKSVVHLAPISRPLAQMEIVEALPLFAPVADVQRRVMEFHERLDRLVKRWVAMHPNGEPTEPVVSQWRTRLETDVDALVGQIEAIAEPFTEYIARAMELHVNEDDLAGGATAVPTQGRAQSIDERLREKDAQLRDVIGKLKEQADDTMRTQMEEVEAALDDARLEE